MPVKRKRKRRAPDKRLSKRVMRNRAPKKKRNAKIRRRAPKGGFIPLAFIPPLAMIGLGAIGSVVAGVKSRKKK